MKTIKIADITTNQLLTVPGLFEEIILQGIEYIRFDVETSEEHGYPDTIFRVSQEKGIHTRELVDLEGKSLEFVDFSNFKFETKEND